MSAPPLRIGTRGSALALAQARLVAEALDLVEEPHAIVVIETEGDRRAPDTAWGEGAFVAAIERALLGGEVDIAVHSAKDIPTDEDARLTIAAYLRRADPRDALVVAAGGSATGLHALPDGARIGTDSPRRGAFLKAHRPDLEIRPLHGNVDTRLRRLDEGQADALVLAVAGLSRLGRDDRITEPLDPELVPPAPGQGAIAAQVRAGDARAIDAVRRLDDPPTRRAVEAERAFLRAAGGGCRAPIGAIAVERDGRITLLGGFAAEGGRLAIDTIAGDVTAFPDRSAALATRLARRLSASAIASPRVLVTRATGQTAPLVDRLRAHGLDPVSVPAIAVAHVDAGGPLDDAMGAASRGRWVVVTSSNGALSALAAAERQGVPANAIAWAAVGEGTATVLRRAGASEPWLPSQPTAEAIGEELPLEPGDSVTVVRGSLAEPAMPDRLRERGALVTDAIGYRTVEGPPESRQALVDAMAGEPPSVVLFASGSAVRGLLSLADDELRARPLDVPAVSIGPSTAKAVREAGFPLVGVSDGPSPERVATLTARLAYETETTGDTEEHR